MKLRANFTGSYLRRYLWMAGLGLAWSAWCAYDGFVAYPFKLEVAKEYAQLQKKVNRKDVAKAWQEICREKGWPDDIPRTVEEMELALQQQFFMGAIGLMIAFPAIFFYVRNRNSWVELTEKGVVTSWGAALNFSEVERLDKTKWAKSGIAKAEYFDGQRPRKFVFDDFKYEREPIGQMLRKLEAMLTPDQIVGGPPEPPEESGEDKE